MSTTANANIAGQALGASTAVGGAIATLPATGGNPLAMALVITAGVLGVIVLISFISTRILRKIL